MMHRFAPLAVFAWMVGGLLGVSYAQSPAQSEVTVPSESAPASEDLQVPAFIAQQRQALALQRDAIVRADQAQQLACWQKFAVNACLIESRRVRRQALVPLDQQELVLNAQERQWRTEQREKRLQGKQPDSRDKP